MIIPGAMAALGYLVFVIALAVFMSLVCSMFVVLARRQSQAEGLFPPQGTIKTKNYNTALGAPTN